MWNAKANEIFARAVELPDEVQRSTYLEQSCAGDTGLRRVVDRLLHAHQFAGDFLNRPAIAIPEAPVDRSIGEGPGSIIGRYQLMEKIGEGGFGVVYRAEQVEPVSRDVALKIIKIGMDTKEVIARFEAERQALAMMDHANIAKVLDAGATETGRPYFVMERVDGRSITEYCDTHRLDTRERLALFINVCQAVQHAHQKGIIHRDLKPSNVLVTEQDGRPVPKVIDFGVAKATQQRLTEKTLFTSARQLIGTPEYMSPEQATIGDADVDTRSDIYSLGVLLYELLVGLTPFDPRELRSRSYDEICRLIRECDPPTPSRRLSTLGAEAEEVSQNRHVPPSALNRLLRGDLDCVVMKALEKERARRYESADALAEDIRRHMASLPVVARPPTIAYQTAKLVRKHRGLFTAAASILAVMLVATVASTTLYLRAEKQRHRADANAAQATARGKQTRQALYVSDVHSAYQAMEEAKLWRVEALLARHIPKAGEEDLREFAWHYLQGLHDFHVNAPSLKHDGHRIYSTALSPNGNILATGTSRYIWLWDLATRIPIRNFPAHDGTVLSLAFSGDGKLLASGSVDRTAKVWTVETGQLLRELSHRDAVRAVIFGDDARQLVTAGGNFGRGIIRIWNVDTGDPLAELTDHQASVLSLARTGDGQLISTSQDRTVKLWDLGNRSLRKTLRGHAHRVSAVAVSLEQKLIASGDKDGRICFWKIDGEGDPAVLDELGIFITSLAFSPTGKHLAAAYEDSTVRIWDVASHELVNVLPHTGRMYSIAFTRDGKTLLCAGGNNAVRMFDLTAKRWQRLNDGHVDWCTHLAVSPDGNQLAASYGEFSMPNCAGDVYLADIKTKQSRRLIGNEELAAYDVAFSPRGNFVAAALSSGEVILWNAESSEVVWRKKLCPMDAFALAFSPDGESLAVGELGVITVEMVEPTSEWGGTVRILDVGTGRVRHETHLPGFAVMSMAYSPDGQTIAVAGGHWGRGGVKIMDATGGLQTTLETIGMVFGVAFSPDGTRLAAADHPGRVCMWVVPGYELLENISWHSTQLTDVAFSPDGKTIASGSSDGTVKLWHVASGDRLGSLSAGGQVYSVEFVDDQTLAAGLWDRRVVLWRVGEEKEVLLSQRKD